MMILPEDPLSVVEGMKVPLMRRKRQKRREKRFMAEMSSPI